MAINKGNDLLSHQADDDASKDDEKELSQKEKMEFLADKEHDKIRDALKGWMDGQEEGIKKRFSDFGILEEAEQAIKQLKQGLLKELKLMGSNFEAAQTRIKENLPAILENPSISDEEKSVAQWLSVATRLAFNRMVNRKINGEANDQEIMMLNIMSSLVNENELARHDPQTGEMGLSLFNNLRLEDYGNVANHELTHYAFNKIVPQARELRLRGLQEVIRNREIGDLSMALTFSGLLLAINESSAYLIEGRSPDFSDYSTKISPRIFSKIYGAIKKRLTDVPRVDYDKVLLEIYKTTAAKWREDMTFDDIMAITTDLEK